MHDFTPLPALVGGLLIGLAASLLLLTHGRVAGISGLYAGMFARGTRDTNLAFVVGLLVAGLAGRLLAPAALASAWWPGLGVALVAGVLVGVGTQVGGGCTSGHGVCGVSRFSVRSIVATVVFMALGIATVAVVRHVLGGAS